MKAKSIILLTALLSAVLSCADRLGEEQVKYVTLSVSASLDTTGRDGTRTYMEDDGTTGKIKWSVGDTLRMYSTLITNLKSQPLTADDISSDGTSASFKFTMTEDQVKYFGYDGGYIAYGNQDMSLSLGSSSDDFISLDAVQTYAGDKCFKDYENAAVGYCPKDSLKKVDDYYTISCTLHNLFGILKVNVVLSDINKSIKSIRLTDKGNKYLAGSFTIAGIKDGTPTLTHMDNSGGDSYTIEKRVAENNLNMGTFYFLVPPGSLCTDKGFDIAVYTNDGFYGGKTVKNLATNNIKIERNKITSLKLGQFIPKSSPLPESGETPIPANETANCYIIPTTTGICSISADYKGNGYQGNGDDVKAGSNTITGGSYAEVIWQTKLNGETLLATELISNVNYFERDGKHYISFNVTGIPGNALVALKDAGGNILWSWHLWITSEATATNTGVWLTKQGDPTVQVAQIMDRNLGALYADPTVSGKETQTHGLAYQFGRKDPFMGSRYTKTDQSTGTNYESFASIYPTTAISCDVDNSFTIERSIKYPYLRAMYSSSDSWCSETATWSNASGNILTASPKSLYDPCPVGWRVIEEINIVKTLGRDSDGNINRLDGETVSSGSGYAFKLSNNSNPIYFPAAGLSETTASVTEVGSQVKIWGSNYATLSTGLSTSTGYILSIQLKGIGSTTDCYTSEFTNVKTKNTMPVRCQKWEEPGTVMNGTAQTYNQGDKVVLE